jgi:phosphoribosylaminoimidazole-succinocarboxamide synthase
MQKASESPTSDVLTEVDLPLGGRHDGKVRVSYDLDPEHKIFVTTDRLSAFDRQIGAVPFKGEILNQLSWWWFQSTKHIVANHAVSLPDPNAMVAVSATPLKVEVIVRAYITGVTSTSLWTQYDGGARVVYGHKLPDGLRKNERLPRPIITPTTKADPGSHDEPITCADVVSRGLVAPEVWENIEHAALELFAHGEKTAWEAGIILSDTKYEFGLDRDGRLMLIDEVHTPDSSRYWDASTFVDRYMVGLEPLSLDKEIIRRALAHAGFTGEGEVPVLGDDVWEETSRRYVEVFEKLTGATFVVGDRPAEERLRRNLERFTVSAGNASEASEQ